MWRFIPMEFSLSNRTATLGVGEFSDFLIGPREGAGGPQGLWRAQLGQHWHAELRRRLEAEHSQSRSPTDPPQFEVSIAGPLSHNGWTLTLAGRIDQIVSDAPSGGLVLREIKTVSETLPAEESALRASYPSYFLQLAVYVVLMRARGPAPRAELVFVEADSGISQTVALTPYDEALVHHQLREVTAFLNDRLRAAERRSSLVFHPAFPSLRPGQETIQQELHDAFKQPGGARPERRVVFLEAPTGYGKTGCVLEFALERIRAGTFERLVWLTGKSTGQLQVVETLRRMTGGTGYKRQEKGDQGAPDAAEVSGNEKPESAAIGGGCEGVPQEVRSHESSLTTRQWLTVWQVRPKAEHCINSTYHCLRDACAYLAGCADRWPQSGLQRFYLDAAQTRDLETLRTAGRNARICPYEITRSALAYNDVWIGDFNYVFAPGNSGIFYDQPGFRPAQTLLVVDEAHNLPSRVADSYSHSVSAGALQAAYEALRTVRVPPALLLAWEKWTQAVSRLRPSDALNPDDESDLRDCIERVAPLVAASAIDHAALGPGVSGTLWQSTAIADWFDNPALTRLVWCPRAGELNLTCLDAAAAIGETLRGFGGALLMSATLPPPDALAAACGLDRPAPVAGPAVPAGPERLGSLTKRDTRRLYRQLTSAAELLRVEENQAASRPSILRAHAPWRDGAYDVAVDVRVDTTLRQRERHLGTTAATIEAMHQAAGGAVAAFFPSYAYAEAVRQALAGGGATLAVSMQPRLPDLAAQLAWVEESLRTGGALFLVLGSSFAEGIDALGGRVSHTIVVGPALPEVNAVQRARTAAHSGEGRDAAFRRVYLVPGLQKVNQALGRIVRAPGHRARVLLHCRRFRDSSYARLLAPEYRTDREIAVPSDLREWLAGE